MKDKRWPRLWRCGHGSSTYHAECSSLHLSLWVRGQLRLGFTAFQQDFYYHGLLSKRGPHNQQHITKQSADGKLVGIACILCLRTRFLSKAPAGKNSQWEDQWRGKQRVHLDILMSARCSRLEKKSSYLYLYLLNLFLHSRSHGRQMKQVFSTLMTSYRQKELFPDVLYPFPMQN